MHDCKIYGLPTNPAAMQTQGHAGGNSSSASCPGKKGPANQNSESEVHIGIRNEEADKLATAATDSSKCSQEDAIGHEGLRGLYWPVQTIVKMSNDGNDAAERWPAGDLTSALKKAIRPIWQAGDANTTLCVDLWNRVKSKLLPNITEYLWTSPHTTQ